jgi:hypothetical protein
MSFVTNVAGGTRNVITYQAIFSPTRRITFRELLKYRNGLLMAQAREEAVASILSDTALGRTDALLLHRLADELLYHRALRHGVLRRSGGAAIRGVK